MVEVHPLTADRLADLDALFGTNKTTAGCQCMWFLVPSKQCHDGWGEVNRAAFASMHDLPWSKGTIIKRWVPATDADFVVVRDTAKVLNLDLRKMK